MFQTSLVSRRDFLRGGGALAAAGTLGFPMVSCSGRRRRDVVVLGVDGMDPDLLESLMAAGRMPNFSRMAQRGSFQRVRTSDPPQSPVAWSNFISGTNPGGHGIFDFIARDHSTLQPFLATARISPPSRTLRLGKYALPLGATGPELLREGPTLWSLLAEAGMDTTAFRAPVNFPPSPTSARTLSGITTPDIHGSYGVFSFFTSVPGSRGRDVAGGRIHRVWLKDGRLEAALDGPVNTLDPAHAPVDIPFTVDVDPVHATARIQFQDQVVVLRQGDWSDWLTLRFEFIPWLAATTGICRLYLKQAHPHLELYVTPVNLDPLDPAMPISTPDHYAGQLVRDVGYFYTQGMPEDTAALSAGVFTDEEFRAQATDVLEERLRFLRHELNRFDGGFLYFYFSSLDLNSHAFWRCLDTGHPLYTPELADRHGDFLPWIYERIDEALGWTLEAAGEETLVFVVSDHGFVPFRRQFNLNSWLADHGYAGLKPDAERGAQSYFMDVDWGRTRAYGLGINSLYLNLAGREPEGTVPSGTEFEALRTELIERLSALRDPATGEAVVRNVYRPSQIYSGPYLERAPDLVVSYNRHYRASWDTILGAFPREHLLDNLDPWSGDHCMDASFLSGVLLCNRPIPHPDPSLIDLAPTILHACSLSPPQEMTGIDLFKG